MMHWSVWSLGISAAILAALCLLWYIERRRGARLLPRFRGWCDRKVLQLAYAARRISAWLGVGTLRIVFHYCVHTVLQTILFAVSKIELFVSHLQQRNRSVVKAIKTQKTQSHLDSVSEHKAAVSLTENQKEKLRDEKLQG